MFDATYRPTDRSLSVGRQVVKGAKARTRVIEELDLEIHLEDPFG